MMCRTARDVGSITHNTHARIDHVFKESPWFHWIGHRLYVRYVRVWMEEARYSKCEAHQYPGNSTASRDGASSAGKNRTTLVQNPASWSRTTWGEHDSRCEPLLKLLSCTSQRSSMLRARFCGRNPVEAAEERPSE